MIGAKIGRGSLYKFFLDLNLDVNCSKAIKILSICSDNFFDLIKKNLSFK